MESVLSAGRYGTQKMSTVNSHSDWWTPKDLVRVLMDEFHFDLDAAASEQNTICPNYISEEQDALVTRWAGRNVYCNPPYGQGYHNTIAPFVQRAYEQSVELQNTVVILLPAYTDPRYWRDYCTKAHEIRFLTGRLAFLDSGKSKMSARFPSALVIFKWFPGNCYKGAHQWLWDWKAQ